MRKPFALTAAALTAGLLPAQADHFTSSPAGYEGTEGASSLDLIGKEALLRFQQIDATNFGDKSNRNRIAFRRDGLLPDNIAFGARTLELEMVLAESNLGTLSTNFDSNYVSGTNTVVFAKKNINLPDWSIAPTTAPQPEPQWFIVFLDSAYSYLGKAVTGTDWLFEVKVYSSDKAGSSYPMDSDLVIPTFFAGVTSSLGTGCVATGQTSTMSCHADIDNYGTKMVLDFDITRAAANAPALMVLGASATGGVGIGFCANLEVSPDLLIPMPNTDLTGSTFLTIDPVTHSPGLIGSTFYGQGVVLDGGLPGGLGLSNGRATTVPIDPPSTPQVKHLFSLDPNATSATSGIVDGGLILHTNHP